MASTIQSFNKGINTDMDIPNMPADCYRLAHNFTYTSNTTSNTGSLINSLSNELLINFPGGYTDLVGYVNIGEDIVLFFYDSLNDISSIYYLEYKDNILTLLYDDSNTSDGSKLNLDPEHRVSGVGRIETSNIKKIYWADGVNEVRYLDFSRDYTNLPTYSFSLLPNTEFGNIIVNENSVIEGGSLKAGAVQYIYRLYNIHGAETTFSQATRVIRLTKYNAGAEFYGTDKDESVDKSIKIDFSDIDTSFDYIKVYAIYYTSYNDAPRVYLVQELEIPGSIFSLIDTGDYPEEITLDEINTVGTRQFIAEDLAEKNNHLFAANIKELYFDAEIDCRAYRFDITNNTSIIADSDETTITIQPDGSWVGSWTDTPEHPNSGTDWSIPTEYDCINSSNDLFSNLYSYQDEDSYFYKPGTHTLGGQGKYVSYEIIKDDSRRVSGTNKRPYADESVLIHSTFKLNEVYRFGVVFFDEKGRPSFTNWIGDILIPYFGSWDSSPTDGFVRTEFSHYAVETAILFNFDLEAIKQDYNYNISGVKIVMVERTESNMSVYTQGFTNSLSDINGDDIIRPKVIPVSFDTGNAQWSGLYYSPDITIGGLNTLPTNCRIVQIGNYEDLEYNKLEDGGDHIWSVFSPTFTLHEAGLYANNIIDSLKVEVLEEEASAGNPVNYYWAVDPTGPTQVLNTSFENKPDRDWPSTDNQFNYGAIVMYFSVEYQGGPPLPNPLYVDTQYDEGAETYHFMPVRVSDIILDKHLSRYGGITYEDRLLNTYIPASGFLSFNTEDASVSIRAYGDSFISYYEQMIAMFNPDAEEPAGGSMAKQSLQMYTLESKVNYNFINVRPSAYMYNKAYGPPNMGIMEVQAEGIARWPDKYPIKLTDLYTYNPVYSIPAYGLYPKYSTKPLKFEEEQENPTMVLASEKKTNGEYVDNWSKFKYANLLEVEAQYGGIVGIKTISNRLFFWQPYAFGTIAVNERSLIQDESGAQLTLGTGGVLERYDYLSTEVGCDYKFSIAKSDNSLFWYAKNKNRLFSFGGQLVDLSLQNGITSLLFDKKEDLDKVLVITDFISNETLFKLDDKVLVLDWITGAFTSFYTYEPDWFIRTFDGNYLSTKGTVIYKHNSTDLPRATYYGTTYDSSIELIVNKDYSITKVFDTLRLDTTSKDNLGIDQYEDTFKQIRVTNNYQNSDWVDLILNTNISRRERSFTLAVPRDIVDSPQKDNVDIYDSANLDSNLKYKRRMRDKFIRLELIYDNSNSNIISFPYVIINYRPSYR